MTIKTFLIAVVLVAGFFTFLSVTWDISAWMLQDPASVAEEEPAKVQPVQSNAVAPDQKADPEKVETTESQEDQTKEPGVYDDSWSGEPPVKTETGSSKTPIDKATTSQKSDSKGSMTVPFASDDRENVAPETDAGTTGSSKPDSDPYQVDERETN